ncbi:hypothetical protein [uncultured Kriegella sp.]|uniref:hypothetical protein n=1 Tax=uncultured Kriegella sp. TaxID=1798910 RepID=UPI0030DA2BC2|tara:strand:+ start:52271 stop:52534 length:264 start_codon:yes stop_codon:yes gene_type:complete
MVEVYKTNIKDEWHAGFIVIRLLERYPTYKINFDLEDCDNILRVEGIGVSEHVHGILEILERFGFKASILDELTDQTTKEIEPKFYT